MKRNKSTACNENELQEEKIESSVFKEWMEVFFWRID